MMPTSVERGEPLLFLVGEGGGAGNTSSSPIPAINVVEGPIGR